LSTDGLAKRASEKSLSRPGRAEDKHIQVARNPSGLRQVQHATPIKAPRRREFHVFDGGRECKVSVFHAAVQAFVGAARAFHLQQEAEPIFKGELGILRILLLRFERGATAVQA
jgi:hypothetical protein